MPHILYILQRVSNSLRRFTSFKANPLDAALIECQLFDDPSSKGGQATCPYRGNNSGQISEELLEFWNQNMILTSRVMMNGNGSVRKFFSSARVALYSGELADRRISLVLSNQVSATPS